MIYRPVYEHNGSTLSADSGFLYTDELKREFFDAFGNIVITQPSGTVIYAQKLNYNADQQIAVLTDNVRMVDGNSTLTTHYLTYNMRSETGTYTGGGRIVNQQDTITSEKAWYFNRTKDAYFRQKVIVRNPDVTILTDTMRYKTDIKTSFFYGATNIQGKNGENLYTEDGYYESESELARFFKNNLYSEKSRFLKGDTLEYDGKTGNGLAIGNVVFIDTADQVLLEGGKGFYQKGEESITMSDKPLVTMVTKQDSTKTDSLFLTADILYSKMIPLRDYRPRIFNTDRDGGPLDDDSDDLDEEFGEAEDPGAPPLVTPGDAPANLMPESLAGDSTVRSSEPVKKPDPGLNLADSVQNKEISTDLKADSVLRNTVLVPQGHETDSLLAKAAIALADPAKRDSVSLTDSITLKDSVGLDTARTRIIQAFKNVRMYKSDLQAVADSAYYGYPDSMLRMYGTPMIWSQNSQLSSDSAFLQIKNEKLDNFILIGKAYSVQQGELDSTKYNQIKGRQIRGFFTDDKLDKVFVDGNAESLIYMENEAKNGFSDVFHNRSSRIKFLLKDNELTDFVAQKGSDGTVYPLNLISRDQEILEGFIWKPSDRPKSKEDLLLRKRTVDVQEVPIAPARDVDAPTTDPDDSNPVR